MTVDEIVSPAPAVSETLLDALNEPATPSPTAASTPTADDKETSFESSSFQSKFTFESDISNVERKIWVVTTASLPWRTGTAINPLLRALYLTRGRPQGYVTLMVPWLDDVKARQALYGKDHFFSDKKEQEEWIREYCRTRANCSDEEKNLRIEFYNGVYHVSFGSIFPTVDICSLIPKEEADVAILDEPEHLNWFRVPASNLPVQNVDVLGWAHKFKHVVGILHTNYESYVKKYGMGTSLLTGPALNALSALVIKAYCHRVIRLSDTLPTLVARKEVTSNVHGVRPEFLDPPQVVSADVDNKYASIYFVGKLIWAKGFEDVLELQERYRLAKGYYFEMDIYGSGNDEKAIKRAFFGRHGRNRELSPTSSVTGSDSETKDDKLAAEIFDRDESLRSLLREREGQEEAAAQQTNNDAEQEQQENVATADDNNNNNNKQQVNCEGSSAPLDVLNDLSKKTLGTGVETAGAALQLVESAMQCGFGAFSKQPGDDEDKPKEDKKTLPQRTFSIGPRIAAFKWRRHPIPARFLGVRDHIELRDVAKQKIFLNMSTSEVLCTTSAEALAMGKFVVLPKHPSNEFFYPFPNCLAYNTLDDCVEKLLYAETHDPEPLSDEHRYMLSWEGATERLFQASGITEQEAADLAKHADEDLRAARFHVETARKSYFVRGLFHGKILGGSNHNKSDNKTTKET